MMAKTAAIPIIPPVKVNGAFGHPYPKYPIKELEIGRTTMAAHGGFWDYFTIFKRQEQAWLNQQKQIIINDDDF